MSKRELKKVTAPGKRAGRGTHGGLTKAGKVRKSTEEQHVEKTSTRKHGSPIRDNRRGYLRSLSRHRERLEHEQVKME
jgi:ribosomal protein S30